MTEKELREMRKSAEEVCMEEEAFDFIYYHVPTLLAEVDRLQLKIKIYESIAQECDYYAILDEMEGESDDEE